MHPRWRSHPRSRSSLSSRRWAFDAAVAAGFVAAGQAERLWNDGGGVGGTAPAVPTAVLVAAISLPLAWRRRYPLGALAAVAALIVVPRAFAFVTMPLWGGLGAVVFALYSASRWAPRPKDVLALAVPPVVLLGLGLEVPGFVTWGSFNFAVPILLVGWLTGQGVRRWHEMSRRLREHLDELERTEAARHAAAVAEERARIARELHDVVAHAVSVMVVQSGSARLRLRSDPAGGEEALRSVEETGRQALVELRHMLGLLRCDDTRGPALAPQPSMRGLGALVESVRGAGADVALQVEGLPVALPPGLDLSAYRIVQEALTNASRHAPAAPVRVRADWGRDELTLEVTNDVPARAAPGGGQAGHGLIGMRERCELFGGTLRAGRTAGGGFAVRAVLPLPEAAPVASPAVAPRRVPGIA